MLGLRNEQGCKHHVIYLGAVDDTICQDGKLVTSRQLNRRAAKPHGKIAQVTL